MRLILTLTSQTEISASRSQKGRIFRVRSVPGWRPADASGLSGSLMSGWNRVDFVSGSDQKDVEDSG